MRHVALGVVLAFSLAPNIIGWDGAILSESISLSMTALVLALLIVVTRGDGRRRVLLGLAAAAVAWVFSRDANVTWMVALFAAAAAVLAVHHARARAAVLVGFAVVLFALSTWSVDAGHRQEFALINVIGQRVLPNPQVRAYFDDHGMPESQLVEQLNGQYASTVPIYSDKPFIAWERSSGRSTLASYLLTHPRYTLSGPWGERETLFAPAASTLGSMPATGYQSSLPSWLGEKVYPPSFGDLAPWAVLGVVFALAVALRWGWDRRWVLPFVLIAAAPLFAVVTYNADAMEPARHALLSSMGLRLGVVWLALVAFDRLLVARRSPAA